VFPLLFGLSDQSGGRVFCGILDFILALGKYLTENVFFFGKIAQQIVVMAFSNAAPLGVVNLSHVYSLGMGSFSVVRRLAVLICPF